MIKCFHITADCILHGAYITKNRIRGDVFRINNTSDIKIINDIFIWKTVDFCDQLCLCQVLGRQGKEDVFFIHIGQCDERFYSGESLFKKQGTVSAISADNRCIRKHFTEFLAAVFIFINNFDIDLEVGQSLCKIVGNCTATNDQSIFDLMRFQADFFEKLGSVFRSCDDRNKITIMNQMITTRNT